MILGKLTKQKHEFLELTKKTDDQVSNIDYARVEALYNELDDMSKQEFCRLYTDDIPSLLSVAAKVIRDLRGRINRILSTEHTAQTTTCNQNGASITATGMLMSAPMAKQVT